MVIKISRALLNSSHPSDDCSHYSNFPSLFPVPHYARHKMSGVSIHVSYLALGIAEEFFEHRGMMN